MRKLFVPVAIVTAAMFLYAPFMILDAPYESTMGLVQKIFYFHASCGMAMFAAAFASGIGSVLFLFGRKPWADGLAVAGAELTSIIGLLVLVTGPLWARKAWGVWWQWDPRVTMATMLVLIFLGYLMVRKYGGPGSEKLAAAMGIFGAATAPFVYKSVDWWRTIHPQTTVMKTLGARSPGMWGVVWFCTVAFLLLFVLLLALRVRLEEQRVELDRLYLEAEG